MKYQIHFVPKAGMAASQDLVTPLSKPKQMELSLTEKGARSFFTRFLRQFISTGSITILEEGETVFTFEGNDSICRLKTVLEIHSPQFYWKVMTQADLGLADAYINGDFSFVDKETGLLNLITILIANRELNSEKSNLAKKRGLWIPMFLRAGLASANYFLKLVFKQNTLTQARRNISRHYDLSNELFALFLDDTMSYSAAVFKSDDEDLKTAQMRKVHLLIDKARIEKNHEVLEIGFGWGTLAMEVVRRTGCKYTGITLSSEQLKYAEAKVKEAGLEDRITFKICDYRQLSGAKKYDRIITCEMMEHVGHEFMETFFSHCDAALADDGVIVHQFITIPEQRYNEYRLNSDFVKEYIFPGGCLPSLARVVSAMASSSNIENVENIGNQYYQTLRCWRKNFLGNKRQIMDLGFDDKFIRTWEYYFDYSAAGLKTLTLGDYQIGMAAAQGLLGKDKDMVTPPSKPKRMEPSLTEKGARILEEGETVLTFEGNDSRCRLKSVLEIHSPQFYWKVMTQADLGLADAYTNGDFSFVDKETGLLNLIMILIANREMNSQKSNLAKKRGWWTPMFLSAGLASTKYFMKHAFRQNTLTQTRRNISRHYDLSNELFALFLDDTMSYSSAVFKSDDEDLMTAQMRKISLLIDKARVEKKHEVLEIGCGWGTLAIEVVRRTGCKYTGITLSIEQLKYAQAKVKEAGLEDNIKFELCDYRQLSDAHKYDRIISCEMIEHVGHEFMETFFSHCEAALAEDGIFVLQFISIPEERYNEYRLNSDFIKEYIFPGGCLPSLARVTSAMASSSNIENVENIGIHYYQTLRCWRKNFLENKMQIMALGFDDQFIRTWEYYFDYCAGGFKTLTLGDYQIVFSRPGNTAAFGNPFQSFPSALTKQEYR
ncbi:unnamed protein product [Thlaspi arvense]|uniref:Cyclopropane-fatty-acyl-phospholipid synthase n=1 Tax=Thlaspi arvense TaxID=13288 RepID=A0AAU9RWL7_THLAR|nr:unnamed protein product [Thlaspi arvense]